VRARRAARVATGRRVDGSVQTDARAKPARPDGGADKRRRSELLQWFALFGGAIAWTLQLVLGFGVALAACGPAGRRWGVDVVTWQIGLMAAALVVALCAEAAAAAVWLETRGLEDDAPPPAGRLHFFAVAALLGNVLFCGAILLGGLAAIHWAPCDLS
jgi:hypothetical protein